MDSKKDYRRILESSLGIPFSDNNSIEILKNGNEIFPAMLEAIKNAKKQIDFLTFVYWAGDIPARFAKELAKKAEEGLQVRALLDCYGAAYIPDKLCALMEKKGVEIQWFRPLSRWEFWKTGSRTHRKILICDRETAFVGGVGIADEWDGDARNPNEYRDNHYKIKGQAIAGLQASFLGNWTESAGILSLDDWTVKVSFDENDHDTTPMQVISTESSVRWSKVIMLFQTLIQMAEDSIYISTAYFNPDPNLVKMLTDAVDRGVTVHILMPGKHNDMRIAKVAGDDSFEPLLEAGVELSYYQKTMYHCKGIVVDDVVNCIGSANFNHRSFIMDDEISVVVINEILAKTLNKQFQEDLKNSLRVSETEWHRRTYYRRSLEKLTYLLKNHI